LIGCLITRKKVLKILVSKVLAKKDYVNRPGANLASKNGGKQNGSAYRIRTGDLLLEREVS
jgi:hypothetical protein